MHIIIVAYAIFSIVYNDCAFTVNSTLHPNPPTED